MKPLAQLAAEAGRFEARLRAAKARISEPGLAWYPYQSLSNLDTFEGVLSEENQHIFDHADGQALVDIGCADGELAFFFESLGFRVDAIDHPIPNYNAMRGIRALKRELGSQVEIYSMNLDGSFELPKKQYELALLLGVLYHLKNPYQLLETLSKRARYCLITTAVTEFVPALEGAVRDAPVAYLADEWELNGDSTNYWICSDAGFRRLLKRTNWDIRDYALLAGGEGRIAGQRAVCLVESRFANGRVNILYGRGWHGIEAGGWRWTEREFSIRVESPAAVTRNRLHLRCYVPDAVLQNHSGLTLRAFANGEELPEETFPHAGEYEYARDLPEGEDVRVDFWLDHALAPEDGDRRERGIILADVRV